MCACLIAFCQNKCLEARRFPNSSNLYFKRVGRAWKKHCKLKVTWQLGSPPKTAGLLCSNRCLLYTETFRTPRLGHVVGQEPPENVIQGRRESNAVIYIRGSIYSGVYHDHPWELPVPGPCAINDNVVKLTHSQTQMQKGIWNLYESSLGIIQPL